MAANVFLLIAIALLAVRAAQYVGPGPVIIVAAGVYLGFRWHEKLKRRLRP